MLASRIAKILSETLFRMLIRIYFDLSCHLMLQIVFLQDRARNVSERFTSTTTLTVNIRDDDDQDPSFIYQGCMLSDGACINPEYSASVRKSNRL